MRFGAVVLTLSLLGLGAAAVHAEPSAAEIAAARELFDQGIAFETKGQWAQALDRFRKVAAVKTTPQVRFHIALCLENTGKLVDALVEFQRAQIDAEKDPAAAVVITNSSKHVAELKERIPRVVVTTDAPSPTLSIDGNVVAGSLIGAPIPLDPGKHVIRVTASKRKTFTRELELVERAGTTNVVATLPPEDEVVAPPSEKHDTEPSGFGPWPWIAGGVGLGALAGSTVFYVLRQRTIDQIGSACPDASHCPEDQRDTYDRGRTYTTVGNVLLGVSVTSLAASTVLFILSPSDPAKTTAVTGVRVTGGPGLVSLSLSGNF